MSPETPSHSTPSGQPRARAIGIPFDGDPGELNAITDVPSVEVGFTTLIEGDDVRTGVTAILPRGRSDPGDPCAAGFHSLNGNGEMTGVSWVEESGTVSLPITLTNTHCGGYRARGHDPVGGRSLSRDRPCLAAPGCGRDVGRLPE